MHQSPTPNNGLRGITLVMPNLQDRTDLDR